MKSDGAAIAGEWVLVSRYLVDLLSGRDELGPTGEHEGMVHEEHVVIHERGTLVGSISGGTLRFDSEGRLNGIEGLRLAIVRGDRDFAQARGGGSLTASNLQDAQTGSGRIALDEEAKR
jgi:hypothetical protein